ncbi:MAG: hypothetical protein IJS01_14400 [Lentisphaeria bacterium]|nr:hypothetical protein [Lentisphaeria bacterium]
MKQLHYERLNNPLQHQSALPKNPAEAEKRGFVRAPDEQNLYHRHKGQRNNVKYHHPETGQEIIFNADGKIVTDIENIGTYNYFPPTGVANNFLHVLFDVVPYYKWGNSEEDTTPLGSRLLGPEKGPAVDLFLSVFKFIHDVKKYFVLSE